MSDSIRVFDELRLLFSRLHSDLVMGQHRTAVKTLDEIEEGFKVLRLEIRGEAAEKELTGENDPPRR